MFNSTNPRTIRGYRLLRKIGSGATADVFRAEKDGQDFAIKVFKNATIISTQQFNNELYYT